MPVHKIKISGSRRSSLLLLLFLSAVLISCSRQCPDFNTGILLWMPYKSGNQILYQSGNDSLLFNVAQSRIIHTGKMNNDESCECENTFNVTLTSDSINISMYFPNDVDAGNCHICLNNECMTLSETHEQYVWNGTSYTHVKIFKNKNLSAADKFEKVILVRQLGILAIIRKTDTLQTSGPANLIVDPETLEWVKEDC